MQALTRETQVPVIMALNTIDEMSPLLGGHMDAFGEKKPLFTHHRGENKIFMKLRRNTHTGLQSQFQAN